MPLMDLKTLEALIARAKARYNALTPEEKKQYDDAQRASFVRSITEWPKPKYKYVGGVKVYESYSDYCND